MLNKKFASLASAMAAASLLAVAACGSDGGSSSSSSSAAAPATSSAAAQESSSEAATGPDLAAATAFLAPWVDMSTKKLLIDQPLSKPIPAGTKIAYLDVGTPVSDVMWSIIQPIAALTGITLDKVPAGQDPESQNTAINTVVEKGYQGIIDITIPIRNFQTSLQTLKDKHVAVASGSVMDTVANGMPESFNGPDWMAEQGKALAASAIVRSQGKVTDFALYTVPEFEFSQYQVDAFQAEMTQLCSSCTVRVVDIPIATLGSTSGDLVVSDLQANPDTGYAVMIADEGNIGLQAKLDVAGIKVPYMGTWSVPTNMQQIVDGTEDAALPVDLQLMLWTVVDQLFREINGDSYQWPDAQTRAAALSTLVTKDNAASFTQYGYGGIADLQDQFAKNWLVGK